MPEYTIKLTREIEAESIEDALEKFNYELDNSLYDKDNIEVSH